VLTQRSVERSTTLATLDGDLVTAHVDPRGVLHVARTDPLGVDERWTFTSPEPLPVPHPGWGTRMAVEGGLVLVDEADGWVLSGDGEVVRSWSGSPSDELEGSARIVGGRLLVRPDSNGGPWPRTQATDLTTGHHLSVQGRALAPWPDDGSLDGSLLVRAGGPRGLVAYDVTSGTVEWSAEGHVEGRAAVLDGRVVRITSGALTSVDGRTGETVWSTPLVRPARTSLATDGRVVVVPELDGDLGVVLGAYGLDDGRLRWRSDVADDVTVLTVFGRQLFGWTGEQLVAFTAPDDGPTRTG
jgi:outer membrane protein assembly factor BamB